MAKIENALTQSGNLKQEVHKELSRQFAEKALEGSLGLLPTPNKNHAMKIAEADGRPVYIRVDFVVTMVDPFVEKKPKAKVKEVVEVPSIF